MVVVSPFRTSLPPRDSRGYPCRYPTVFLIWSGSPAVKGMDRVSPRDREVTNQLGFRPCPETTLIAGYRPAPAQETVYADRGNSVFVPSPNAFRD